MHGLHAGQLLQSRARLFDESRGSATGAASFSSASPKVNALIGRTPGSMFARLAAVRIARPAAVRSITASANCTATRIVRPRPAPADAHTAGLQRLLRIEPNRHEHRQHGKQDRRDKRDERDEAKFVRVEP